MQSPQQEAPKWAIFQTTLWILGCIFAKWLGLCQTTVAPVHMQIGTNMNRNFCVITIQSDTSASGWKFLQLHSSFFIVSKIIISATEQAWEVDRDFSGTSYDQQMTIPLWAENRKFSRGDNILVEKALLWHQAAMLLRPRFATYYLGNLP